MTTELFKDYEAITFRREGRILTITLNQPDTLNAVSAKLHSELARVFGDAQKDPESDILVLTGAGRAFSAGGNVGWMQDAIDNPEIFNTIVAVEAKRIIFSQLELEKPLLCRMNGHAMGLGATIALACDIVIASDQAKIGDPHVLIGYSTGDGGAFLWPQLIGYLRAKEYLLTGDPIPAVEAARMGLINRAVPPQQLDDEVYNLARRLAGGARKAIRWTKVSINLGLKQLAYATMDSSLAYEAFTNLSKDHQEAVAAFREKRKPIFTGE